MRALAARRRPPRVTRARSSESRGAAGLRRCMLRHARVGGAAQGCRSRLSGR